MELLDLAAVALVALLLLILAARCYLAALDLRQRAVVERMHQRIQIMRRGH